MKKIGIIGGGITGLTLSYTLQKEGNEVVVWESSPTPGGAIKSKREGDWLAESGPNSIQDSDPSLGKLVHELGLSDRLLEASTSAKRRFIVRYGKPQLVPNSLLTAISTPLFSWKAKVRVLGEPFRGKPRPEPASDYTNTKEVIKPDVAVSKIEAENASNINPNSEFSGYSTSTDESLASFVRRRLGQEFLDYAINPFVGGIYAGNPENLSVKHGFPKIYALEEEFGSLIKGAVGRMGEARKKQKESGDKAHKKRILSFPDGLSELTNALAVKLENRLQLNSRVTKIERTEDGRYRVTTEQKRKDGSDQTSKTDVVDTLIYAGTAYHLSDIEFIGFNHLPDVLLPKMVYAPVTSLTLGFDKKHINHKLDGFGVLVPEVEPFEILGCLFTSSIFPGRAPEGFATLTTFLGGMRNPAVASLDDHETEKLVIKDLNKLLGISGEPVFRHLARWPKAIPQYEVGFGMYLQHMDLIESSNPGFHFAGNYKTGISLDASIRHGLHPEL